MDDAKPADQAEEVKLTPAQLAEIEENKRPFLDKFKDLVNEANDRLRHGTSLTQTFVSALQALYDEAGQGRCAAIGQDRRRQACGGSKSPDDAKKAEQAAADALAQDGLDG